MCLRMMVIKNNNDDLIGKELYWRIAEFERRLKGKINHILALIDDDFISSVVKIKDQNKELIRGYVNMMEQQFTDPTFYLMGDMFDEIIRS
jgi:hypothetical protein